MLIYWFSNLCFEQVQKNFDCLNVCYILRWSYVADTKWQMLKSKKYYSYF